LIDIFIENEAHERTIVARFAFYFREKLNQCGYEEYDMDIEYNRNFSQPKRTLHFQGGTFPDVIIHKRGSNEHNLCIIEFKTGWRERNINNDLLKLKDFTSVDQEYKFGIGFLIIIDRGYVTIRQIEKGCLIRVPIRIEVPT